MLKNFLKKITPSFLINWYHFLWSFWAAVRFGFPSRKLKVIGVTGTKGKSSTVFFIARILQEAGFRVGAISSIGFKIDSKEWPNNLKMTMPGRGYIQKMMSEAKKAGCEYFVLEVTSEGILQHRHRFIDFDVVVFTGLHPEHIERHGGFENYKKSKGKLFQQCQKTHVINIDDPHASYFLGFPSVEKYGYSKDGLFQNSSILSKINHLLKAENVKVQEEKISFSIEGQKFLLYLKGDFNVANALAAVAVGLSQGVDLEVCRAALEKIKKLPGRMEIVIREPFKIIVDSAHTPQSLEKVYNTLTQEKAPSAKLICVLGAAGGGRDKWKRPKMGEIAAFYCDEIILTNEDPFDEDPQEILSGLKEGILKTHSSSFKAREILDRREAIKTALTIAKKGDIVVITGKGSEQWMCLAGGKKIPWDDRKVVREEFMKLYDRKI